MIIFKLKQKQEINKTISRKKRTNLNTNSWKISKNVYKKIQMTKKIKINEINFIILFSIISLIFNLIIIIFKLKLRILLFQ